MANNEGRPSRKRPINKCDDNLCDFTPLSKRINNLHLTRPPSQDGFSSTQNHQKLEDIHHTHQQHTQQHNNGLINGFNGHPVQPQSSHHYSTTQQLQSNTVPWVTDVMMSQYAPTIEETDSPFYYEHNKLLFALHLERLQRNHQSSRPFS